MNTPHPGELRHRIHIGRTVNTINENGYPTETDTTIATVWAGITDAASKYYHEADVDNARHGLSFSIRWRHDVEPGMWVDWNGKRYTITSVGEFDFKRRYMKLVAEAVEGVA